MEPNAAEKMAREIVARLSKKAMLPSEISNEMSFAEDLGIDSLQFICLILELESKVGARVFTVESISRIKNFNHLIQAVSSRVAAETGHDLSKS